MRTVSKPALRKRVIKPTLVTVKGAIINRAQKAALFRPGTAPRVEPSTNGAKQWTAGRRDKHKQR